MPVIRATCPANTKGVATPSQLPLVEQAGGDEVGGAEEHRDPADRRGAGPAVLEAGVAELVLESSPKSSSGKAGSPKLVLDDRSARTPEPTSEAPESGSSTTCSTKSQANTQGEPGQHRPPGPGADEVGDAPHQRRQAEEQLDRERRDVVGVERQEQGEARQAQDDGRDALASLPAPRAAGASGRTRPARRAARARCPSPATRCRRRRRPGRRPRSGTARSPHGAPRRRDRHPHAAARLAACRPRIVPAGLAPVHRHRLTVRRRGRPPSRTRRGPAGAGPRGEFRSATGRGSERRAAGRRRGRRPTRRRRRGARAAVVAGVPTRARAPWLLRNPPAPTPMAASMATHRPHMRSRSTSKPPSSPRRADDHAEHQQHRDHAAGDQEDLAPRERQLRQRRRS